MKISTILACSLLLISINSYGQDMSHLVSVEQAKVEKVEPTLWLPGNVVSRENAPISAEQMGQLLWILDVGSKVEKGQVIAKIDNRHLKLQLAQQQSRVTQKRADVEYLTKQKQRLSKLNAKNNTALSELERTVKDLTIAEAEVNELTLQVELTELAIEKTNIVAPFTGYISQRFAHLGELVSIGRPLVQLVNTNALDIQIAAPIQLVNYLQAGASVNVKWENKLTELPVRTWSMAGDQTSRTFDVRLSADNLNLLPGSAVTVSLPKNAPETATLVPRDALVIREKETFVLKVNEDNTASKVSVLIGQGSGDWIAVTGRVDANDEVIVRGGESVRDGQKVRVGNRLIARN